MSSHANSTSSSHGLPCSVCQVRQVPLGERAVSKKLLGELVLCEGNADGVGVVLNDGLSSDAVPRQSGDVQN